MPDTNEIKTLIIDWADTLVVNSKYTGEVDWSCFSLMYWNNIGDVTDPSQPFRKRAIKFLTTKNADGSTTIKSLDYFLTAVKSHLLDNGYINEILTTRGDKIWLLTENGKLMKELGSHAKYKSHREWELKLPKTQLFINLGLFLASIAAILITVALDRCSNKTTETKVLLPRTYYKQNQELLQTLQYIGKVLDSLNNTVHYHQQQESISPHK